jgi:Uma2 family endonuclease
MSPVAVSSPPPPVQRRARLHENQRVLLHDVPWEQYLRFRDAPSNAGVRMYYADGDLLLMTTGSFHERASRLMSLALLVWAEAEDVQMASVGRWTLQELFKKQGLEADDCYYVTNAERLRGKKELDLAVDPPPDLAIEIDVTTDSQHKLGIYANLGVPEVWVWTDEGFKPHRLMASGYAIVEDSQEFPGFPFEEASDAILDHVMVPDDVTAMRSFRALFATLRRE